MTHTMTRPATDPGFRQRKQPITDEELGRQFTEMITDLRDIANELKTLNADRYIPGSISPLVTQAIRNAGWAADHLSNAQLVLQASAIQRGEGE